MDIHMDQYAEPTVRDVSKYPTEEGWSQRKSGDHAQDASIQNSPVTRRHKIGMAVLPAYASPPVQLALVAFISFLCPGMWNALNGLGGGGLVQVGPANNANVALYSTFSVAGFFAGVATNRLGVRVTLSLGGLGYSLYSSSLLCYKHTQNSGFLLFAGLQLGLCAGLFWAAQGMVMTSYPTEESKGRYISWSWMIYNMGAVIGSLIALIQNIHSEVNDVGDITFYVFIALSLLGTILALLLSEARHVERADGSRVTLSQNPTWKGELMGLFETLKHDAYILLFFPMFFASNFFYPYQFNTFNLATFNIRTRALNNTLYWLAEIAGAYLAGYALDSARVRRSLRARVAAGVLLVLSFAVWGGGYVWQKNEIRSTANTAGEYVKKDFHDSGYVGSMFLYLSYGLFAAAWQICLYWFIGALTNDSRKLANFTGFYKGVQSAGGAVSFRVNTLGIYSVNELVTCWTLLAASLIIAAPVIVKKIRDHD